MATTDEVMSEVHANTHGLTEMAVNGGPPAPVTHEPLGRMIALSTLRALVSDAGCHLRRGQPPVVDCCCAVQYGRPRRVLVQGLIGIPEERRRA